MPDVASRTQVRRRPAAWVGVLAATQVVDGCAGASASGVWTQPPTLGALVVALSAAVFVNLAFTAALFWAVERRARNRRVREALRRELQPLRHSSGPEAVARKAALVRELNTLGAAPAELDDFELAGADLRGVRLSRCSLRDANLAGADLQGAYLEGCDLFGASLHGTNLALASLSGANLRGCDLESASLIKADLRDANLHRAELVAANLHRAALSGARLTMARFARRDPVAMQLDVHASVEDWIRERLDPEGRFRDEEELPRLPPVLRAG